MNNHLDFTQFLRASKALFPARLVLFVALFAWYLCAIVDLRLVFEARDELFLWNLQFFTDFTGRPGSLVKWADRLLVQWGYYGWPGAAALALLAWLLLVSTAGFMSATARAPVGGTWLIPGAFLVWLESDYYFARSNVIGLTLAMAAANGWARLPARWPWPRLALFVVLASALYYIAGAAGYCFLACCVVHKVLAGKCWLPGIWLLLAGAGVKFGLDAALAHFDLASRNYHVDFRPAPLSTRELLFFCYFPICAALAAFHREAGQAAARLWHRLGRSFGGGALPKHTKGQPRKQANKPKPAVPSPGVSGFGLVRWTAGTMLMLALPAAAGWYALDRNLKAFLEIDCCAEHQLWNDLLAKAGKLRQSSLFTNHNINLALYHTGRLPYEMFSYPQQFGILIDQQQLPAGAMKMLRKPAQLLLELGRVNEAERAALEMLELCPTGRTLKQLAVVKMIKNQPAAARLFLNVLRDDLVLGGWAEESLRRLATDPELAGDAEVQRMRGLMLREDDLQVTCTINNGDVIIDCGGMLLDLLKQNARNRMAFEYLMAMHLLACNVPAVIELFPFLDQLSYSALPPYYEEAALLYGSSHPRDVTATPAGIFFHGRKVSESTVNKFKRLQEIMNRAGGSIERARPDLARELGDSYFTYYLTHSAKPHE